MSKNCQNEEDDDIQIGSEKFDPKSIVLGGIIAMILSSIFFVLIPRVIYHLTGGERCKIIALGFGNWFGNGQGRSHGIPGVKDYSTAYWASIKGLSNLIICYYSWESQSRIFQ